MKLRLVELHVEDSQARKIKMEKRGRNWEDSDGILHYQSLLYVHEIIRTELISKHQNDPLVGHFGIEKIRELIARKYYLEILYHEVEVYVKGCDICLASKVVKYKPYENLQKLSVPIYC